MAPRRCSEPHRGGIIIRFPPRPSATPLRGEFHVGLYSERSQGDILHFHRIHGAHHNRGRSLSRKRSIADHCIVFDGSDVFGEIE